jgi:hypothetical protein
MLSFCSSNGAIVPDHVMLADYQGKILRVANDATASVLDVYLKKSADSLAAVSHVLCLTKSVRKHFVLT